MRKSEAVIHYNSAMTVFEKWLKAGLISEEEFTEIDTITAAKYGLSLCSIYRRNRLINQGE